MKPFVHNSCPVKVIFGCGTISQLPDEVKGLCIKRPLILTTPGKSSHASDIEVLLSGHHEIECVGQFNNAVMHTPVDVTKEALEVISARKADGLIAIGGGSTIGLSKAIALRTDIPQIFLPTTYAGSEMSNIIGETENGIKTTKRASNVLPKLVIYDVDSTLSLPPSITACSGLNAIAHAVEALYARDGNPLVSLMAEEGIRSLARALPLTVANSEDKEARSDALYGAWLCSCCLGAAEMGLHHKLCHVLGGTFNLPHAETHAIMLPHTLSYNAHHIPEALSRISRALDNDDAVDGLNVLLAKLKVKRGLNEIGMPQDGIEKAANLAMKNQYWSPRTVESDIIRELFRRAWAGEPAKSNI